MARRALVRGGRRLPPAARRRGGDRDPLRGAGAARPARPDRARRLRLPAQAVPGGREGHLGQEARARRPGGLARPAPLAPLHPWRAACAWARPGAITCWWWAPATAWPSCPSPSPTFQGRERGARPGRSRTARLHRLPAGGRALPARRPAGRGPRARARGRAGDRAPGARAARRGAGAPPDGRRPLHQGRHSRVRAAEIHALARQLRDLRRALRVRRTSCVAGRGDVPRRGRHGEGRRGLRAGATVRERGRLLPRGGQRLQVVRDRSRRAAQPFEAARIALEHGDQGRAIRSLAGAGALRRRVRRGRESAGRGAEARGPPRPRGGGRSRRSSATGAPTASRSIPATSWRGCWKRTSSYESRHRHAGDHPPARPGVSGARRTPRGAAQAAQARECRPESAGGDDGFDGGVRYEILEEVGRGGMGIVFKARDRRLGRVVALKKLPDNVRNHPKAVELFLREARASAALNHPNIVTIHDAGSGRRRLLHHHGADGGAAARPHPEASRHARGAAT